MSEIKRAFIGFFLCMAVGCTSNGTAPVINKSPGRVIPQAYSVKSDDNIYEIAWAFGVDYLDIAKWNNLKPPYAIASEQILYLRKPAADTAPLQADDALVAQRLPGKPAQVIRGEAAADEAGGEGSSETVQQASVAGAKHGPTVTFSAAPSRWRWPAEGTLIGRFKPGDGRNGIQIAGHDGSPVVATADGTVVYAGEGLRGYGKLLIVKHSVQYLSAYAHNQEILVQEGQQVQAGNKIASMGSSSAPRTMLHFEIRKDGKPIDPLAYLQ